MHDIEKLALSRDMVVGIDTFKLSDTAHETLCNESKQIKDKKSKYIKNVKRTDLFTI